jgi:glycerate kinase
MPSPSALLSPASLKGVLSAAEAAAALAQGFAGSGVRTVERPVADGGEGTAAVIAAACGGRWHEAEVSDPLGRPVTASWLELPDGTGVVESADPLGLWRVELGERDPLRSTSRGLGELIVAAGDRPLLVCLGGVATVDGGRGLRDVVESRPERTRVACDVRSPLLDAARLFARQKGASEADVVELERRLEEDATLAAFADVPGGGAAGGLGAALAALGAELVPGAPLVLEVVGFDAELRESALVVSGEGTVDRTTQEGKAPLAVAVRAEAAGVPCVVFGGIVAEPLPRVETVPLSGVPSRARDDLVELGRRLAARVAGSAR